jgi:hypothetical protein
LHPVTSNPYRYSLRKQSLPLYPCEPRIFSLLGGHCEVVFSFPKQSLLSSPHRNTRLLRRFAPRSDKRGTLTVKEKEDPSWGQKKETPAATPCRVTARSSFRFRSNLVFFCLLGGHCEVVVSPPKQSQRSLAASRLGMTPILSLRARHFACEAVSLLRGHYELVFPFAK